MCFKRLECPICNQKISFLWNYFSLRFMIYTCPNCKTRIKWKPITGLYGLIGGIIMFSIFFLIKDYIGPPYIALIIGFIPAQIVCMIIVQKVKPIKIVEDKKTPKKTKKNGGRTQT